MDDLCSVWSTIRGSSYRGFPQSAQEDFGPSLETHLIFPCFVVVDAA
jgi:hypothetical protein